MQRHRDVMFKSSLGYNSKFQASLKYRVSKTLSQKEKEKLEKQKETTPKRNLSQEKFKPKQHRGHASKESFRGRSERSSLRLPWITWVSQSVCICLFFLFSPLPFSPLPSSPLPLSGPPSMRTKVPWRVSLCKVSIFLDPTMLLKTTGKQHYFKARGRCQGNKGLSIWDPSEVKCRQVGRYSRWSEAELERQTRRDTVSLIWDQSLESTMEVVLWSPHMLGHHTPTDLKHT